MIDHGNIFVKNRDDAEIRVSFEVDYLVTNVRVQFGTYTSHANEDTCINYPF